MSRNNAQSTAAASTAVIIKQKIVQNGCGCGSGCGIFILILLGLSFLAMKSCVSDFTEARDRMAQKPKPSPSMQTNTTAAPHAIDAQTHSNIIASLPPRAQKFVEDVRNAPPAEHYEKLLVIEKAKEYASPKLKNPATFTVTEVIHYTHAAGDFYLVRFTADGRNLRVGVTIADDGTISIIDKAKLPALLEASNPAKK